MNDARNINSFSFKRTRNHLFLIATATAIGLAAISGPSEAGKAAPTPNVAAAFSATWSLPFATAQFATVDPSGNVIAVGNDADNIVVSKYDTNGTPIGAWTFPDSRFVVGVATDLSGNIVIASRGTLSSLTPTGLSNFSYTPALPILGMAVDPSGNVVIAEGDWYTDLVIEKLSSTGVFSFTRSFTSTGGIEDFKLATDSAGNIVIAAAYQDGTMSLGGVPLTTPYMDAMIVAKLSPLGSHVFSKIFNPTVAPNGSSAGIYEVQLAVKSNNEIVVTGTVDGTGKFVVGNKSIALPPGGGQTTFLSKFNATGTTAFAKTIGNYGVHSAAVAIDNKDNIVITGEDGYGNFVGVAGGVFVASYAGTNGAMIHSALVSDTGWGNSIAVNATTNDVVVAAGASGTQYVTQLQD